MKRVKKMRKTLALMFFLGIATLFLFSVAAQTTNLWSAGPGGTEKNAFSIIDDVYVKSKAICEPATDVDLYVIINNDNWTGGEALEDVRESSQNITLKNFEIPLTKIWDNPKAGNYDIVVDCNKNGEYDFGGDKIDDFSKVGFTVTATAGTGKAELGKNSIGDHSWSYDPETPSLVNVMLQLSLLTEGEDIELSNITIRASGTGNDAEIDILEIYADENNNGNLDTDEIVIGDSQPAYMQDNGIVTIPLDYFLTKNVGTSILIVYTMKETIESGNFSLAVESIYGIGTDSNRMIKLNGLPINSGIKKALPKKTCLGNLNLSLEPNPTNKNAVVKAKITGLSGCENRTISLKANPCGSAIKEEVGSCTSKDGECETSFTASTSNTYYICIDKNGDGDAVDFGEYAFQDLVVTEPKVEKKVENVTKEANISEKVNVTEEINETQGGKITGEVIGGLKGLGEKISTSGTFLILLEITLLLILFVLIMILFKLRGPIKEEKK